MRMMNLSKHNKCFFVQPSSNGGTVGALSRDAHDVVASLSQAELLAYQLVLQQWKVSNVKIRQNS